MGEKGREEMHEEKRKGIWSELSGLAFSEMCVLQLFLEIQ